MFRLEVRVLEGRNMIRRDTFSASDPYVEAGVRGGAEVFKTHVVNNTSNPIWSTPFTFTGNRRDDILVLRVMDFDPKGIHDFMGEADINLAPYLNQGWKDFWVQLWTEKRGFLSSLMRNRRRNQINWVRAPGDVHIQLNWVQVGGMQQGLLQGQQMQQPMQQGLLQGQQMQQPMQSGLLSTTPALTNTQPVSTPILSNQPMTSSQMVSGQPLGYSATTPISTPQNASTLGLGTGSSGLGMGTQSSLGTGTSGLGMGTQANIGTGSSGIGMGLGSTSGTSGLGMQSGLGTGSSGLGAQANLGSTGIGSSLGTPTSSTVTPRVVTTTSTTPQQFGYV